MNIKKAIIIGASSGIGKGISLELLKKGYKIAISARRKERLDEIKKLNPDMVIVKEYDSSTEKNDELINNLIDKLNGVDLIIYCSGIGIINKELDYSLEKKVNKFNEINIFNYGIADVEEDIILNQNIESSSSSINNLNKNSKYYKKKYLLFNFLGFKKTTNPINIKTIKLANFIDKNKIDKIDLLKIDTEGYEFNVIKGLGENISKIKLIHLEHHFDDMIIKNYKLSDIHNYLKN